MQRSVSPEPIFIAPIHEGGVRKNRGINVPVNTRFRPERSVTLGYTASNSYLNPGFFVCAASRCELEYASDHTGNLLYLDLTEPVLRRFELGFGLGIYRMDELPGWSPLHRLASDRALRWFHEHVLNEQSLPELSAAPDGRQLFSMTDFAGRELRLEPAHSYALPLRASLTRYFPIRRKADVGMGLAAGLHLSYPLEGDPGAAAGRTAFARGMDLGLSVDFTRSRRLTANVTATYYLQLVRFRSDVHVVNPASPRNADDNLRSQYALGFGLGFAGTFAGRAPCALGISQLSNTAHIDKELGWTWDPLVFEGGNNLRGALAGANDYGVLTFGCSYRSHMLQLALAEDIAGFSQFLSDDGAGTSYDPDFTIGISATWRLGSGNRRGKQ